MFYLTCDVTGDPGAKFFNFIWKISSRPLHCCLYFSATSIGYRDRWVGGGGGRFTPQKRAGVGLGPARRGLNEEFYHSWAFKTTDTGSNPDKEHRGFPRFALDPLEGTSAAKTGFRHFSYWPDLRCHVLTQSLQLVCQLLRLGTSSNRYKISYRNFSQWSILLRWFILTRGRSG